MTSLGNAPFVCALYTVSFLPLLNLPFVAFRTLPAAFFKYVSVYNNVYSSKYIMITNGIDHFVISSSDKSGYINILNNIPDYED